MLPSSGCRHWQPEHTTNPIRGSSSYTTGWDTIVCYRQTHPAAIVVPRSCGHAAVMPSGVGNLWSLYRHRLSAVHPLRSCSHSVCGPIPAPGDGRTSWPNRMEGVSATAQCIEKRWCGSPGGGGSAHTELIPAGSTPRRQFHGQSIHQLTACAAAGYFDVIIQ